MEPVRITWPGSDDLVTLSLAGSRSYDAFDEIAEFLSSRLPHRWPPSQMPDGSTYSVDQRFAWRAEMGRIYDRNGVVLLARHTASNNRIIAVSIAQPTEFAGEAERVIEVGNGGTSYEETVGPLMLVTLRKVCADRGLVLGKVVMVRRWVPA